MNILRSMRIAIFMCILFLAFTLLRGGKFTFHISVLTILSVFGVVLYFIVKRVETSTEI